MHVQYLVANPNQVSVEAVLSLPPVVPLEIEYQYARIDELVLAVAAMFRGTDSSQVCCVPLASAPPQSRGVINGQDTAQWSSAVNTATNMVGNSSEIETETHLPAVPTWAVITSTPCENRFTALATDDDGRGGCDGEFTVVSRERRTKRSRQQSSPVADQQQQQKLQKRPVLGKAANVRANIVGSTVISAAKKIAKKAVFCIDNVSTSCKDSDICRFVSALNIKVVSCFEVKPRRRRDEDEIERNEDGTFTADRKAFRLCVYDDDRDRVMDAAVWPDSVIVSEWFF